MFTVVVWESTWSWNFVSMLHLYDVLPVLTLGVKSFFAGMATCGDITSSSFDSGSILVV